MSTNARRVPRERDLALLVSTRETNGHTHGHEPLNGHPHRLMHAVADDARG
jgi:hypothetical protein